MADLPANPYASPGTLPDGSRRNRPMGTSILAVLLMIFGTALSGGMVVRSVEMLAKNPSFLYTAEALKYLHMGIIGTGAIGAALGLLSGNRYGWWLAVWFCYFAFASFIVLPIVLQGPNQRPLRDAIVGTVLLLYWFYLHKRSVLSHFAQTKPGNWRAHVGLFLFSVLAVIVLEIW